MATCPECEFDEIDTEDYEEGDKLNCPECGTALFVSGSDEVELVEDDDDLDDEDDLEEEEEDDDEEDVDEDDDSEDEEEFEE